MQLNAGERLDVNELPVQPIQLMTNVFDALLVTGSASDTTPIDDMPAYLERLAAEVEARRAAGIGAAGERADTLPFVPGLEGPDQFFDLADRLAARGHSRARIEKILGGNFLAFAREIWG